MTFRAWGLGGDGGRRMADESEEAKVIKGAGVTVSGELMVPPPPPGEHLWVLPVWYQINEDELDKDVEPDEAMGTLHITFGNDNMVMAGTIGCIICRHAYDDAKDEPCPGRAG